MPLSKKSKCADCEHNGAWGAIMKCHDNGGCLPGYKNYEPHSVQPNNDALQSISSGIKRETSSTVPPEFRWQDQGLQPIPNCPDGRYRGVKR